jgi:hypothetical protein
LVFLVLSFFLTFLPISIMHSSSPHSCYMPCQSHTPWLDHSNYTWWRVQVMNLLTMQFYATSRHFISLQSKYSPQHPVLKHPQSMSSLNVTDQVSHPHRTIGKIIVLYILICMFLDSWWEDKRICTEH